MQTQPNIFSKEIYLLRGQYKYTKLNDRFPFILKNKNSKFYTMKLYKLSNVFFSFL